MGIHKALASTKSRTKTGTPGEPLVHAKNENAFGSWLKRRRKALDLTQDQLSRRVGIAPATLQKIEQSRRRPSSQIAHALADTLALDDSERVTFLLFARGVPVPMPLALGPSNLPSPLTALIDRHKEVAAISEYLLRPAVRLVTLTGAPGVGKTRLGIQTASELRNEFREGVWFVPLAPIDDPVLVIPTLMRVLGISGMGRQPLLERLKVALRDKRMLIVLDNFEQVVEAGAAITELLGACPALKVFATSRVPLHVYGEHEYHVEPFPLPKPDAVLSHPELMEYEAIRLFVFRVQAFRSNFVLNNTNARAVLDICRRLDGMPLAIELAAAGLRRYTLQTLAKQLASTTTNPLPLLSGGPRDLLARQQSLHNAIAWSYNLLPQAEQKVFREMGVFVGGGTLAAILGICQGATPDRLVSLVEHSVVQLETDDASEPRYGMLEMIRAFALDRLLDSRKQKEIERQHAVFFLALARNEDHRPAWLDEMQAERGNLRAALRWLLDHRQGKSALELCNHLRWFWEGMGYQSEGRRWMNEALTLGTQVSAELRVSVLEGCGAFNFQLGDYPQARVRAQEAVDLSRESKRRDLRAQSLLLMGRIDLEQGDYPRAQAALDECLPLMRKLNNSYGLAGVLKQLGDVALEQGEIQCARLYFEESLGYGRNSRAMLWVTTALIGLGWVTLVQGGFAQARNFFREACELAQGAKLLRPVTVALSGLASAIGTPPDASAEDIRRAACLWGAANGRREESGLTISHGEGLRLEKYIATAHARLSVNDWEKAWAGGTALSLVQAVSYALENGSRIGL